MISDAADEKNSEQLEVENCVLPLDLWYDTDQHLWLRSEDNDCITIGLTDMAQTLAGKLLYVTPRKSGSIKAANKSLAVYEAAKWLGVIRVPFPSTIISHNQAVQDEAFLVNQFPYSKGWILKIKPDEKVDFSEYYISAEEAAVTYRKQMNEETIPDCVHCLGFSEDSGEVND